MALRGHPALLVSPVTPEAPASQETRDNQVPQLSHALPSASDANVAPPDLQASPATRDPLDSPETLEDPDSPDREMDRDRQDHLDLLVSQDSLAIQEAQGSQETLAPQEPDLPALPAREVHPDLLANPDSQANPEVLDSPAAKAHPARVELPDSPEDLVNQEIPASPAAPEAPARTALTARARGVNIPRWSPVRDALECQRKQEAENGPKMENPSSSTERPFFAITLHPRFCELYIFLLTILPSFSTKNKIAA